MTKNILEQESMISVNIIWEKYDYNEYEISKLSSDSDYGIYQIYGRHNAYGKDALLYIGLANDQTFSKRLAGRAEFIESSASPNTIRIGRIVKSNDPNELLEWPFERWDKIITACEKLLIIAHSPAFNKQNNSGLYDFKKEENIHILNWDDFGDLLPEVSSYRYSYKYWKYDMPLSIINKGSYK